MSYRHHQLSLPALLSFVAMTVLIGGVFFAYPPDSRPLGLYMVIVMLVIAVHYAFSSLTVEVSSSELTWYFASGIWRKRVALTEIADVKRIRLPWWYGIGIKYTPRAWV